MADTVYLIPGGGLYLDTEQGEVVLVPGAGLVQEQEASGSPSTLLPNNLTVGTPVLGSPDIGQIHAISATGISAAPAMGSVSIGQAHILSSVSISATPAIETSTIGQVHVMASTGISSIPVLGTPTASSESTTDSLTAVGISSLPAISSATLGQIHALGVSAFLSGTPAISDPVIEQIHALLSSAITAAPALSLPTISQNIGIDVLTATGIAIENISVDGDYGATFAMTNLSNCDVSVDGTVTTTDTPAAAYSTNPFESGSAVILFKVNESASATIGLNLDPTDEYSYLDESWAFYSGICKPSPSGPGAAEYPFTSDTVFKIVYDGSAGTIGYYLDGDLKYTSVSVSDSQSFYFDCELSDYVGDAVTDINYPADGAVFSQIHVLSVSDDMTLQPLFGAPYLDRDRAVTPDYRLFSVPQEIRVNNVPQEIRVNNVPQEIRVYQLT